jgi:hypothetical protein
MQTVQVFDTWVTTPDSTLHFDVMTAPINPRRSGSPMHTLRLKATRRSR